MKVKAIVITGKGPMFCGGAEITEFLGVLKTIDLSERSDQRSKLGDPGYVCCLIGFPVIYGMSNEKRGWAPGCLGYIYMG